MLAKKMFALNLKRVYCVVDRLIIRNLRSRSRRLDNLGSNPGLDNRLQAFREEGLQILDDDAEEFVEQSESDFYKVGDTYNEHLNETLIGKHALRHHIVKDKYFKENMPNLLTWSEKEQIRHLATTQPNEWTPERIAESFPVTLAVVKKLLKYPWKPATEQRIARHDSSAMRNWKELKEGSLDIPDNLRSHFLKFSDRTLPPLNKKSIKIDITKEKEMGEFESIVRRCAAKENLRQEVATESESGMNETEKKNIKIERKDRKPVTLEELKTKIKKRLEDGQDVDMNDEIMLNIKESSTAVITSKDLSNEVELDKDKEIELTGLKENKSNETPAINYPERIRIPKKAYKRGATYKIDDCYYDHDGRFLYRVLGMSN